MQSLTFTITGDVNVSVLVTEQDDGSLKFDLTVLDDTGSIGDLNAIYFDLLDDSLSGGLSVTGDDVTGTKFNIDGVTKIDNFTNVNGEVVNEYGRFDAGVQFGTAGMAQDDIRETSFVLSHDTIELSLDMLLAQDFAIRLTSVGEEGGVRDGSVKLGGEAPDEPDVQDPGNEAIDDVLVVSESESFNPAGGFDDLEGGQISVLENDVLDTFWFETQVQAVNDDPAAVDQIVQGSNGGLMVIRADGTVDFSADGAFDHLDAGQRATTEFTYAIEGGDTATVTVIVNGEDDGVVDPEDPPVDPGIDPI